MEQHKLLKEYLEIFSRFSANGLSKQQRKQRHVLLSTWEKKIYTEPLPTLEDLEEFRKLHGNYSSILFLYGKLLFKRSKGY